MNKEIKIGKYTPKDKFLEFVGTRGNIQFISDEAIIEAKHLSGLDMDDVFFKLTIRDEGTVDFDEIETNKTTEEQRGRLLEIISEKTISPFNKKMVITELPFKSTKKINDKEVDLYLVVDYQKPIEKLASIFDDVDLSDEQHSKIDDFLTSLGIDFETPEVVETIEVEEKLEEVKISNSTSALEDTFKKLKEEKVAELKKQLAHQKTEAKRFEYEKSQAEKKLSVVENDIKVLESRIESLEPVKESNGYYFFVSEQLNEKITLDEVTTKIILDKISKVKGINPSGFMKLFEQGEFQVKIGKKDDVITEVTDYANLPKDIKDILQSEIGIFMNQENNLVYVGDLKWHDIVGKFIKNGFMQDPEFDKICGSNSYSVGKFATDTSKSEPDHKCSDDNCCPKNENENENNMTKFKTLASFNKPTDIVIIGHNDDMGDEFKVTDDESAFDIYVDGKPYKDGKRFMSLGCFGFGSVITLEQFKNMDLSEVVEDDGYDSIVEGIIVQNFVGEIGIGAINENNDVVTEFDLDDYIQHQVDCCDVVVNIPSGFNIIKLNGDLSLPTSVMRDVKIEDVLNK